MLAIEVKSGNCFSIAQTSFVMTRGKHILVTGGAGYIGSHACKMLAQAGYVPISSDNLVFGHEWAVKWVHSNRAISATENVSTR